MVKCKYDSFNALSTINDPELLNEAFQKIVAEAGKGQIKTSIYLHESSQWHRLGNGRGADRDIAGGILAVLENQITPTKDHCLFYEPRLERWFCSYKPLSTKIIALSIESNSTDLSIDEDYLQRLFQYYCHQMQMLQGTYRDALTGLYNRRAFDEKMVQLLESHEHQKRRAISFTPTIYTMLDIDYFKRINDTLGHLYGDEVLLLMARLMTESFRENDLIFRYGGEEFAMVMMDISGGEARLSLDRFREKVSHYKFPNLDQITISIGYTRFDLDLSIDDLITQADNALYHCKATTRNAVHDYHQLVEQGLLAPIQTIEKTEI